MFSKRESLSLSNASSLNPSSKHGQNYLWIFSYARARVEKRNDAPTFEKRLRLERKADSIVVEIKFVQDTNESYGRKSSSKLGDLVKDYDKNKKEGHKYIILVFIEKGKESYLTADDIERTLEDLQRFTVFHMPRKSKFD